MKKKIKGSIEPTQGSVCSDLRKLQSMDVLKLQSTKRSGIQNALGEARTCNPWITNPVI